MNVFLWNARARNGHVEATLNHPFPAQVENLTKPKATVAIEAGEPTHDPKVVAQSILHSLDAGHFNVACGDFGIGLLARAANGLSVRTTLVLDCLTLPVIALIGAVYRRMWDRIVRATPN